MFAVAVAGVAAAAAAIVFVIVSLFYASCLRRVFKFHNFIHCFIVGGFVVVVVVSLLLP